MGNCCPSKSRRSSVLIKNGKNDHAYNPEIPPFIKNDDKNITKATSLQHIQDREPDDPPGDPSVDAKTITMFLSRSNHDKHRKNHKRRKSLYDNHSHPLQNYGKIHRKYNSCSTIFIDDSTVSQPNLKNTIRAVALAVFFHIRNREKRDALLNEDEQFEIFDEKLHPLSKEIISDENYIRDPEHKIIYRFIRNLFHSAQLTAECAIVTLVYLERLLTYSDMQLQPNNWKRIVLGAILLASKVWDDQAVWNVDYCQILKDATVEDMNELERHFLELLQFNINVSSSIYAKYYFDLRALADANDLNLPFEALSKERAVKLEAMSNCCEDKLKVHYQLRRCRSLDASSTNHRLSKAILS